MGAGRRRTSVGADGRRTNSSAHLQNGEARGDMPIRVLVTGGTFDKNYDELTGRLFFRDTHVPEMLRLGRARLDLVVETVMMIDSLEMDDECRARIVERCRASEERGDRDHARHRHDGRHGAGRRGRAPRRQDRSS